MQCEMREIKTEILICHRTCKKAKHLIDTKSLNYTPQKSFAPLTLTSLPF